LSTRRWKSRQAKASSAFWMTSASGQLIFPESVWLRVESGSALATRLAPSHRCSYCAWHLNWPFALVQSWVIMSKNYQNDVRMSSHGSDRANYKSLLTRFLISTTRRPKVTCISNRVRAKERFCKKISWITYKTTASWHWRI
jgi:hypothetical protein